MATWPHPTLSVDKIMSHGMHTSRYMSWRSIRQSLLVASSTHINTDEPKDIAHCNDKPTRRQYAATFTGLSPG